jgi:WD40 repeat protein
MMPDGGAAAFSPNGRLLLIHVTGEVALFELAKPPRRLKGWAGASGPLAALENGKFLCSDGQSLQILAPAQEGFVRPYVGHKRPVRFVRFDPSGKRLFSQGQDNRLIEWNLQTGKATIKAEFDFPRAPDEARWSRDGRLVLLRHLSGEVGAFTVHDLATKHNLRTFKSEVGGHGFISGDNQEITMIHGNGALALRRWSIASGEALGRIELGPPGLTWSDLTWSADGSKFIVWTKDVAALVYDVNEGKVLRQWKLKSDVVQLVVSDDGKRAFGGKANGHIDVYDLSKEPVGVHNTVSLHRGPVQQLYPSPDGKRLVSVDDRSHVVIWNTATWKMEVEWDHKPKVAHLAWARDSRHLAIANDTLAIDVLRLPPAK